MEQLNLTIFYEEDALSEVPNSPFSTLSAAEPGTCWCHFLKTPGHDYRAQNCTVQEVRTSCIYTQPTAYHIQILPWILKLHFKSHWLQVTYISCLTWDDIALHYFATTIPLKCLWLSSFWLVKNVESPVFSKRHTSQISQSLEGSVWLAHHKTERTLRNGCRIIGCKVKKISELHWGKVKVA